MNARSAPLSSILPAWTLPIALLKDLRVVTLAAASGISVMILLSLALRSPLGMSGIALDSVTCSAIAAMAFGHDFLYRTLASSLALPVSRSRVWRNRMLLALAAMVPVTIVSFLMSFAFVIFSRPSFYTPASAWLHFGYRFVEPILNALCLAPFLTLISRSALFGTVLSLAAPFLIFGITNVTAKALGFWDSEAAISQMTNYALPCVWVAGVYLGWRKFITLEVIDAGAGHLATATKTSGRQSVRRSAAVWQLFKKEIMLQRMSIGLAVFAIGLVFLLNKEQATLWSLVYPAMLIVLIGSVACSEERQLGTAEWQTLLPIAFSTQWTIKVLSAWALALIFGLILPFAAVFWKTGDLQKVIRSDLMVAAPLLIAATFLLLSVTLYISSLCNSSIKAMMISLVVNTAAAYAMIEMFDAYSNFLFKERGQQLSGEWWWSVDAWPFILSIAGLVALALHFAMHNQRSVERGAQRLLRQVAGFALFETIAILGTITFWNWVTWLW